MAKNDTNSMHVLITYICIQKIKVNPTYFIIQSNASARVQLGKQKPFWVIPKDQNITMRSLLLLFFLSWLIRDYLSFICILVNKIKIVRKTNIWQKGIHWFAFWASDPILDCSCSIRWGRGTADYLTYTQIIKKFKYNLMNWVSSLKDYI